ncbi:MAG: hypothetical protein C5B54_03430 [Acidobacteria bacterium]|nr:MAG: hypothetical protein C5B54_03430 [Acidobacteriota bacterium]
MAIEDTVKGWPWYAQVALFLGIAVVLFYFGNRFMIEPQKVKMAQLNKERDQLLQEINKGETLKSRYIEFEAELKRLETQLDTLKKILPSTEEIIPLYSRIQQEATELGLVIVSFKPGGKAPQQFYDNWPLNMTLNGNYHTLAKFFERLGKLYRIINVNDVSIKPLAASKTGTNQNTIASTCIATTFIYKEESTATTTTKGAKAPPKKGGLVQ